MIIQGVLTFFFGIVEYIFIPITEILFQTFGLDKFGEAITTFIIYFEHISFLFPLESLQQAFGFTITFSTALISWRAIHYAWRKGSLQ